MPRLGAPLKVAKGLSKAAVHVFSYIFWISLIGMFVFLILICLGYSNEITWWGLWISLMAFSIGALGRYMNHLLAPAKYMILKWIISWGLFMLIYYFLQKTMPLDLWKFLMVFLNSWLTGVVGSFAARAISAHWKMDASIKNLAYNALVSLFYTTFIILGIWALFFDEFDIGRFIVIFGLLKLASDGISYGIARKMGGWLGRAATNFMEGK